jgi:hypothetical protein
MIDGHALMAREMLISSHDFYTFHCCWVLLRLYVQHDAGVQTTRQLQPEAQRMLSVGVAIGMR